MCACTRGNQAVQHHVCTGSAVLPPLPTTYPPPPHTHTHIHLPYSSLLTPSHTASHTLPSPTHPRPTAGFGPVLEVKLHKKGGYGFVRFERHDSAVQCIVDTQGVLLFGRVGGRLGWALERCMCCTCTSSCDGGRPWL
jgi:hypothetical protein